MTDFILFDPTAESPCDECDYVAKTFHGLQVHRGQKHARKCPVCGRRLLSAHEFAVHALAMHHAAGMIGAVIVSGLLFEDMTVETLRKIAGQLTDDLAETVCDWADRLEELWP